MDSGSAATGLRYVDSVEDWKDRELAAALDELRRGASPVASVKAARLSRMHADLILEYIDELNHDIDMLRP